jgi:uroporphyrin-III C-methyltransferase/precorrin-2 dehydrogenase/sirohydrochlorin ferrochelatase
MGGRTAPLIADRLIACGMVPATPVVMMSAVTRPGEHCWQGTLEMLGDGTAEIDPTAPVIIGVGEVFADAANAAARPDGNHAPKNFTRHTAYQFA